MNQYLETKVSDNDDQYFKTKSKLIKQKGLFGQEGHELFKMTLCWKWKTTQNQIYEKI